MESVSETSPMGVLDHQYENSPADQNVRAREHLLAILETLSNKDAFEIFGLAADGIYARTDVLDEYHFTRKRYYVRLKRLLELGLVQKDSRKYVHTSLGRVVYETLVKNLGTVLLSDEAIN